MTPLRASREGVALLPWLAAAVLWAGLVTPMRADQDLRLKDQARIRQDRVKADRRSREVEGLKRRISASLDRACRGSSDPAALRQAMIASSASLPLSPFSLSVTGGVAAGAAIEAQGSESAVFELLRRIGDPGRGSFLRTVTVRERGGVWTVSAQTGVVDTTPAVLKAPLSPCDSARPSAAPTPSAPTPPVAPVKPRPSAKPVRESAPPPPSPTPEMAPPPPTPPFTLVAFLESGGRARASLLVGEEVRVVSIGDQVSGWRCVSIDRDLGVDFVSATGFRATLRAAR